MYLSSLLLLLASYAAASVLTVIIPSTPALPNPNILPPTTHATLTSLSSSSPPQKARLTRSLTFVFRDLNPSLSFGESGRRSYLLDIHSRDYVFAPYRVDVAADGSVIGVWETYRGNAWDNKGAEKFGASTTGGSAGGNAVVEARLVGKRGFYEERSKFSPLSLFKNPMILLGVVALGITFGMPYLMENMDPEMRAEFEKQSRASPLAGATRSALANQGGGQGGGAAAAGFDFASWMAGTGPGPMAALDAAAKARASGQEGGSAGPQGQSRRRA